VEESDVSAFAEAFHRFLEVINELAPSEQGTPLRATLEAHLGRDPQRLPVVAARFAPFEHVNVQVALEAWLEERDGSHDLLGVLGDQHGFMSFADLVQNAHRRGIAVGAVDYVSLADGPGSARLCVQSGLYLIQDDGISAAILLRGPQEHSPHQAVTLEVLAEDRGYAEQIVASVRRLSVERSVFRNQVLSFADSPFGEQTAGPIAFHARPQLAREDVILPEDTFAAIEEHVFGIATHRERLRESGQHLKRGLLLHGPPGTGKTLMTRYLIGRLVDHTVVVLSGAALQYIEAAATLARSLQPALVVLEDVDLVANERMPHLGHASPLLFALLNVMDGLDEDADLTFLLTTNRPPARDAWTRLSRSTCPTRMAGAGCWPCTARASICDSRTPEQSWHGPRASRLHSSKSSSASQHWLRHGRTRVTVASPSPTVMCPRRSTRCSMRARGSPEHCWGSRETPTRARPLRSSRRRLRGGSPTRRSAAPVASRHSAGSDDPALDGQPRRSGDAVLVCVAHGSCSVSCAGFVEDAEVIGSAHGAMIS
jgi:hypothetical protein